MLAALRDSDEALRPELLAALEALSHVHPWQAGVVRAELVGRLAEAPPVERLIWIEAISALGTRDPKALAAAMPVALELVATESSDVREERRRKEALQRLLEVHPGLSADLFEDVVALARQAPEIRELFLEMLAASSTAEARQKRWMPAEVVKVLGRLRGPSRRTLVALLERYLATEARFANLPELSAFARDGEPDVVLAAAGAITVRPAERATVGSLVIRLEEILHHEGVIRRRLKAVELLEGFASDATAAARALLAATNDGDAEVREAVLNASVRLTLEGHMDPMELGAVFGKGSARPQSLDSPAGR